MIEKDGTNTYWMKEKEQQIIFNHKLNQVSDQIK